jgi:hypothetical protein
VIRCPSILRILNHLQNSFHSYPCLLSDFGLFV